MRIVAGSLRGRQLAAPAGEHTRPTIDRVREALFSSLYSLRGGLEGAVVLDAFAGSGAMGLEALSRGASKAVFYESDRAAARVVERNIAGCKVDGGRASLHARDVLANPPVAHHPPFDLVLLDPPYAYDAREVLGMVSSAAAAGAVAPGAIVVYEHALKSADEVASAFEEAHVAVKSTKKYGKIGVTVGIIG